MKPKAILKLLVDMLMTLALLLLMGFQFWGDEAHEWIGIAVFVLFIAHHILNRNWHKNLFRGKYNALRMVGCVVDVLLLVAMVLLAYSGMVMSRYVLDFVEIKGAMALARRLHILASYWGFILMSVHLGLHWSMIIGMAKKCMKIKALPGVYAFLPSTAGALVAVYGAYVFMKRDFPTYLLLKSEFVFMDYSESKILFYLDYLALMGLFVFIAHFFGKFVRKRKQKPEVRK